MIAESIKEPEWEHGNPSSTGRLGMTTPGKQTSWTGQMSKITGAGCNKPHPTSDGVSKLGADAKSETVMAGCTCSMAPCRFISLEEYGALTRLGRPAKSRSAARC